MTMTHTKIAVIPGDGIGKEVMEEALKVLNSLQEHDSTLQKTQLFFLGARIIISSTVE